MYVISDLYMDVSYTVNFAYADVKQQKKTKPTEHQHSEIPLILLLKTFKSVLCDHTVYFHIVHHDNHEDTHMCSHHLTVKTRGVVMTWSRCAWRDWIDDKNHAIYVIYICESILYVTIISYTTLNCLIYRRDIYILVNRIKAIN